LTFPGGQSTRHEARRREAVEEAVRSNLQSLANTFVTAIDAVHTESGWAVRADVAAPLVLTPGDVRAVEERAAKAVGEPVELTVRARTDVLVTGKKYQAVGDARLTENADPTPTPESRSPWARQSADRRPGVPM
jgi:hypothetical protein